MKPHYGTGIPAGKANGVWFINYEHTGQVRQDLKLTNVNENQFHWPSNIVEFYGPIPFSEFGEADLSSDDSSRNIAELIEEMKTMPLDGLTPEYTRVFDFLIELAEWAQEKHE